MVGANCNQSGEEPLNRQRSPGTRFRDLELEHHFNVLVFVGVAVEHEGTEEGPESHADDDGGVRTQHRHVLLEGVLVERRLAGRQRLCGGGDGQRVLPTRDFLDGSVELAVDLQKAVGVSGIADVEGGADNCAGACFEEISAWVPHRRLSIKTGANYTTSSAWSIFKLILILSILLIVALAGFLLQIPDTEEVALPSAFRPQSHRLRLRQGGGR